MMHEILKIAKERASKIDMVCRDFATVLELQRMRQTANFEEILIIDKLIEHISQMLVDDAEKALKEFHL